jgi:hypothetical protein
VHTRREIAKKYFGDVPPYHHGNMGLINLLGRVSEDLQTGAYHLPSLLRMITDVMEVLKWDDVIKQEILWRIEVAKHIDRLPPP